MRRAREVAAEHEARSPHASGRIREAVGELLVSETRRGVWGHVPTMLFGLVFIGFSTPFIMIFTPDGDATTTGTVVEVHRHVGDDSTTCSVTTDYIVDARTYRTASGFSSSGLCSKDVGGSVEVVYDSTNPSDAEVDPGRAIWMVYLFPAAGALIFLSSLTAAGFALAAVSTGRRMVREGRRASEVQPASSADQMLVEEATRELRAAVVALRGEGKPVDSDDLDPAPVPYFADAPVLAPDAIAPGWYRTIDGTSERWHNGVEWTPHVRPYAPSAVTPPSASAPGVPPTSPL